MATDAAPEHEIDDAGVERHKGHDSTDRHRKLDHLCGTENHSDHPCDAIARGTIAGLNIVDGASCINVQARWLAV